MKTVVLISRIEFAQTSNFLGVFFSPFYSNISGKLMYVMQLAMTLINVLHKDK